MQKRCYSLLLCILIITACTSYKTKVVPVSTPPIKIVQVRNVQTFNQVDVQGQINVALHTGYKNPQVILKGDARDLAAIEVRVEKNTLFLNTGKGYPIYGPVFADVRGRFLNRIVAKDTPRVIGDHLKTSLLDVFLINTGKVRLGNQIGLNILDIRGRGFTQITGLASHNLKLHFEGTPKVQLVGRANLSHLIMQGSASVSLYWVKTDTLTIRAAKNSAIQLAGAVNRLDVELWDNARFKGRYLRAQRSFVKTHGHSVAEIATAKHQSNFATDRSDIYYYNLPDTRAGFMAFDGSILDMREWNQFALRDFDRYNKQFP